MSLELPEERLATTNETGGRVYLFPARVRGFFKDRRDLVYAILILVFLGLPWIEFGGEQWVRLDLPNRQFNLFGLTLFAHDTPLLFFVVVGLALTLGFVTAIWGRVWCGWACPQTVFIDAVFRRIEEWVEGSHLERRRKSQEPIGFRRLFELSAKWFLFLLLSSIIAHSFLAYFVGSHHLVEMMSRPPQENWTSFLLMLGITGLILFDFGWFREQFCIIACPYGRFQSVLMDSSSMAVLYDEKRGEPRRGAALLKSDESAVAGDCVNCYRCVQVCPTGIDIRRGIQLECIACTACMDACDEIMAKVNKPSGLIRYASEDEMATGKKPKASRARVFIYAGLLSLCFVGLGLGIYLRSDLHIKILRAQDQPYQLVTTTDDVMNHLKLHIKNQSGQTVRVSLSLVHPPAGVKLVVPVNPLTMKDSENFKTHFFVQFPKSLTQLAGVMPLTLRIEEIESPGSNPRIWTKAFKILGPQS